MPERQNKMTNYYWKYNNYTTHVLHGLSENAAATTQTPFLAHTTFIHDGAGADVIKQT